MSEFNEILKQTMKLTERTGGGGGMEIQSFKEAGLMTNDVGIVVQLGSGEKFNITVDKDDRHGETGNTSVRDFLNYLTDAVYQMEEELDYDADEEPEEEFDDGSNPDFGN